MYCKTINGTGNKIFQYLTKAHDTLENYGMFNRFKITGIETDSGNDLVSFKCKFDEEATWVVLYGDHYKNIVNWPEEFKNIVIFLFSMQKEIFLRDGNTDTSKFPFNKEEIDILTLAGTFVTWDLNYTGEKLGKHIELFSSQLRSHSCDYELEYMLQLYRFNIGGEPISFKILSRYNEVTLRVIEPEHILKEKDGDMSDSYQLVFTFGEGEDKGNTDGERLHSLFSYLDGRTVSTDTNLRDLYFNADQYLRIANIKEEKLVSITTDIRGTTTRYLGGLYSGFSMSMSRTDGIFEMHPFPVTHVTIGGKDVSLACSIGEIETALGLN